MTNEQIQALADRLWDKWVLREEGRVLMTKDLFTLSIQDILPNPSFGMRFQDVSWKENFEVGDHKHIHIGTSIIVNELGDPDLALSEAKNFVHEQFKKRYPYLSESIPQTTIPSTIPDIQITKEEPASLEEMIKSCTSLRQIEEYQLMAKSNPRIKELYDEMKEMLSQTQK